MNVKSLLSKQGINISADMEATKLVDTLMSMPTFLNKFPSVKSSIENVYQVYNTLTTAKDKLNSLEDSLESAEKFLVKMKDAYDKVLQLPGAYSGTGVGAVTVNPMPSITIGYSAIVQAQKSVDKAQDLVDKAQSKVDSLSNKLEEAKKAVVKKIISLKV